MDRPTWCALAGWPLLVLSPAWAQTPALPTDDADTVLVQGGRLALRAFDTPGAVHVVEAEAIAAAGPQVNLSEALGAVPSIV